jgi:hypothetical protein
VLSSFAPSISTRFVPRIHVTRTATNMGRDLWRVQPLAPTLGAHFAGYYLPDTYLVRSIFNGKRRKGRVSVQLQDDARREGLASAISSSATLLPPRKVRFRRSLL